MRRLRRSTLHRAADALSLVRDRLVRPLVDRLDRAEAQLVRASRR